MACAATQKALNRLDKWTDSKLTRTSVKSYTWRGTTPGSSTCWGHTDGKQPVRNDLGSLNCKGCRHWNVFHREMVNAPCLSMFKRYLDKALNIML